MWTLAQLIAKHADSRPELKAVGKEPQSIWRVRDYLETHYAENVSLEQLAAIADLSPFYLSRTFRDRVGLPPHSYLNQVRVMRTKGLLSQKGQTSQVADQTGFAARSHLTKQFKRILGITPGQYRLQKIS